MTPTQQETDRSSEKFGPMVEALVENEGEWWTPEDLHDHLAVDSSNLGLDSIRRILNAFAREGFTSSRIYDPLRGGRIIRRGVRGSYQFTWLKGMNEDKAPADDDDPVGKMFEVLHVTPGGNWLVGDGDYEFLVTPVAP
jgi:hypothetical protein